ncbi:glycerate kinase type-2 family protein [Thermocladium modestius]|nr:glycerate kinase [Thermocladium modestius]
MISNFMKDMIRDILEESDLYGRARSWLASHPLSADRIHVISMGKGAVNMAAAAEEELGSKVVDGIVVVPQGTPRRSLHSMVLESTHPLPSEASLRAGEAIMELLGSVERGDLVLFLISGGGSALVEVPAPGISLEDLRGLNELLIMSGATIEEINAVRKHVSAVKGGRLAKIALDRGARVVSLLASDVPGDDPATIASGPTVPDPTTYGDAVLALKSRGIWEKAPPRVRTVLEEGMRGLREETPKELAGADAFLMASNMDVLRGLSSRLARRGIPSLILTSSVEGEAREVGRFLASIAVEAHRSGLPLPRGAILVGGEPTVMVRGNGKGGRTTELCAGFALGARGVGGVYMLSLATDGQDGNMDAAGCVADGETMKEAERAGVSFVGELGRNNTAAIFEATGSLIRTGLTGSNLNIISVVMIDSIEK